MSRDEPDEEMIAPCCDNCDGDDCPGMDMCLIFLKFVRRETFYNDEGYKKKFGDY